MSGTKLVFPVCVAIFQCFRTLLHLVRVTCQRNRLIFIRRIDCGLNRYDCVHFHYSLCCGICLLLIFHERYLFKNERLDVDKWIQTAIKASLKPNLKIIIKKTQRNEIIPLNETGLYKYKSGKGSNKAALEVLRNID